MATAKTKSQDQHESNHNEFSNEFSADVLYQKLGDRWFAFSVIADEVFMTPVDENKMDEIRSYEV